MIVHLLGIIYQHALKHLVTVLLSTLIAHVPLNACDITCIPHGIIAFLGWPDTLTYSLATLALTAIF